MLRIAQFISSGVLVMLMSPTSVSAALIFQSGALGTSVDWSDIANGTVLGTSVDWNVYLGVRFQVTSTTIATRIGGHFVAHPDSATEKFFGALVKLTSSADLPDSYDLSTPDVMGTTAISFTNPSSVVFGDLAVRLSAGWYGVVFGNGLFGTDIQAEGAAVRDGADFGNQSYFGWQPNAFGWYDGSALPQDSFDNHYFVVEGNVIPESSSLALALLAAATLVAPRLIRR
jgi:hypothetical protein